MVKRRKECVICTNLFAITDVLILGTKFESDSHRTIAEVILALANVEFCEPISEQDAFICKDNCYRRLTDVIKFQDMIKDALKRFLHVDVVQSHLGTDDFHDGCIENKNQSMEKGDLIDWDEKSNNALDEKPDLFDVQFISNELVLPLGWEAAEEEEAGKLFMLPDAEYISISMQFENFEYLRLNGHRCCGCAFIGRNADELSQHSTDAHHAAFSCYGNGKANAERPYVCSVCSATFKTEQMLESHKLHQTKHIFLCKCCRLSFSTKQHLMKHIMELAPGVDTGVEMMNENMHFDDDEHEIEDGVVEDAKELQKPTLLEDKLITHVEHYDDYRILHTDAERCCSCGKFFANYQQMLVHAITTHVHSKVSGECTCPACGETFKTKKNLKTHQAMNSSFKKIYHCTLCDISFVRVHLLARHLLTSLTHRANQTGNLLEKHHEEKLGSILRQNSNNYSVFSGFGCCFIRCGATFDEEAQLQTHVEEVHAVRRRINISERTSDQHVCDVCQLSFVKVQNLNRHRNSWLMRKVNICSYCGKGFPNQGVLWEHEQVEHTDTNPQFECDHCGKRFKKKSLIKLHLVTHQKYRKFGCEQCGSRFHFGHQLKKHQNAVHATELPYECKYCDVKLPCKPRYDQHMRRHTGERPYACRYACGRTFSSTTDRRRHEMGSHTGEKPHKCVSCERAFVRRRELQQHLQKNPHHSAETDTPHCH